MDTVLLAWLQHAWKNPKEYNVATTGGIVLAIWSHFEIDMRIMQDLNLGDKVIKWGNRGETGEPYDPGCQKPWSERWVQQRM